MILIYLTVLIKFILLVNITLLTYT